VGSERGQKISGGDNDLQKRLYRKGQHLEMTAFAGPTFTWELKSPPLGPEKRGPQYITDLTWSGWGYNLKQKKKKVESKGKTPQGFSCNFGTKVPQKTHHFGEGNQSGLWDLQECRFSGVLFKGGRISTGKGLNWGFHIAESPPT